MLLLNSRDVVAHLVRGTAPPPDEPELNASCTLVATAFTAFEANGLQVVFILTDAGKTSAPILDVHPWWKRAIASLLSVMQETCDDFDDADAITIPAGQGLEIHIAAASALVNSCAVCNSHYRTRVNVTRCLAAHDPKQRPNRKGAMPAVAHSVCDLVRFWDAASAADRRALLEPYTCYAAMPMTADATRLVAALADPGATKGITLATALDACTEGTFMYRKIRGTPSKAGASKAAVANKMDRSAALGLAVADALWTAVADAAFQAELDAADRAAAASAARAAKAAAKAAAAKAAARTAIEAAVKTVARDAKRQREDDENYENHEARRAMALIERMRSGRGKVPTPAILVGPVPQDESPAQKEARREALGELRKLRAAWVPAFPGQAWY